jgi:large subunit ribosomal protein L32
MGVPKRRTSKRRIRIRRAVRKVRALTTQPCPQCGAPQRPHRVCPSCGYYRGRQVITVATD